MLSNGLEMLYDRRTCRLASADDRDSDTDWNKNRPGSAYNPLGLYLIALLEQHWMLCHYYSMMKISAMYRLSLS